MKYNIVYIIRLINMKETRRQQIKKSLQLTRLKRQSQRCKTIELKIDTSKLNKEQTTSLKMFFVEAKWLYNYILSQEKPFDINYKIQTVTVLNRNKQSEQRELKYLPAKNKQDIVKLLHQNIYSLSSSKKKHHKVGRLKFKSSYNSINLSQYGTTHKIMSNNTIRINGINKYLYIYGLEQIKNNYELTNAKLLQKPSGYYIKLTCYEFIKPEVVNNLQQRKESIGIDFGIKNNFTMSNGQTVNVQIEETERLKCLQQKLSRRTKGSNNRYKTQLTIQKEYEKIKNKKVDIANKIVNYLLTNYSLVCIQDEQLQKWHRQFGKKVQSGCLGLVKSKLKQSKQVKVIDKFYPSTKLCYQCGHINEISLPERVYKCSNCGLTENRDVKAAKTILHVGLCLNTYVPMDCREFKSAENVTAMLQMVSPFVNVSCVR